MHHIYEIHPVYFVHVQLLFSYLTKYHWFLFAMTLHKSEDTNDNQTDQVRVLFQSGACRCAMLPRTSSTHDDATTSTDNDRWSIDITFVPPNKENELNSDVITWQSHVITYDWIYNQSFVRRTKITICIPWGSSCTNEDVACAFLCFLRFDQTNSSHL